ncbi:MAG: T9SS type A sorting domain-containing protein [Crocinitomicaceae bacterium]
MKNKLILFFSVGFFLFTNQSFSQQVRVGRQSINALGSSTVSNGVRISHTVGQASSTSVSKSGNIVIRQGFQQANLQYEVEKTDFDVQLYPNPNDGDFNVSVAGILVEDPISYQILDLNGKIVLSAKKADSMNFSVSTLGIEPGMYYLTLKTKTEKNASIKFCIN